jgi:hypothetical protein
LGRPEWQTWLPGEILCTWDYFKKIKFEEEVGQYISQSEVLRFRKYLCRSQVFVIKTISFPNYTTDLFHGYYPNSAQGAKEGPPESYIGYVVSTPID